MRDRINLIKVFMFMLCINSYPLFSFENRIKFYDKGDYVYVIVKVNTASNTNLPLKLINYLEKKGFKHEIEKDLTHKFVYLGFRNKVRDTVIRTNLLCKDFFNRNYKIISIDVKPVNPLD